MLFGGEACCCKLRRRMTALLVSYFSLRLIFCRCVFDIAGGTLFCRLLFAPGPVSCIVEVGRADVFLVPVGGVAWLSG